MYCLYPTAALSGHPKTCHDVQAAGGLEGVHYLDPGQDNIRPLAVFCNMSSSPVTAVLHHNLEEWTHVTGYDPSGSYNGEVRVPVKLRWIFPGASLIFNGAPGNIQDNLDRSGSVCQ